MKKYPKRYDSPPTPGKVSDPSGRGARNRDATGCLLLNNKGSVLRVLVRVVAVLKKYKAFLLKFSEVDIRPERARRAQPKFRGVSVHKTVRLADAERAAASFRAL